MLYIYVELSTTVRKLNVVRDVRTALTCFADTSNHLCLAELMSISAVSLMYIFVQIVGMQPFLVEGGFADGCLK